MMELTHAASTQLSSQSACNAEERFPSNLGFVSFSSGASYIHTVTYRNPENGVI